MQTAIIVLTVLGVVFGIVLGYAAVRYKVQGNPLVDKIDTLLPQTQCGQCGYPGCKPYATAIANNEADINQCPPGGESTIIALADLLGREPKPLNPENGSEAAKTVAWIDESTCIGCTLCIQACPVDAIVGAAKLMHTIIEEECTGCDLCIPPCPVDCIKVLPAGSASTDWVWNFPDNLISQVSFQQTQFSGKATNSRQPSKTSDASKDDAPTSPPPANESKAKKGKIA